MVSEEIPNRVFREHWKQQQQEQEFKKTNNRNVGTPQTESVRDKLTKPWKQFFIIVLEIQPTPNSLLQIVEKLNINPGQAKGNCEYPPDSVRNTIDNYWRPIF